MRLTLYKQSYLLINSTHCRITANYMTEWIRCLAKWQKNQLGNYPRAHITGVSFTHLVVRRLGPVSKFMRFSHLPKPRAAEPV